MTIPKDKASLNNKPRICLPFLLAVLVHWSVALRANSNTSAESFYLYVQVVIVLTVFSIYAIVLTRQFSLPTPILGHILSLLLPISTFVGLLFPGLLRPGFLTKTLVVRQQPAVLSILSLFETLLVTLASTLLQANLLSCELEHRWRTLFQHHNVNAIRGIQDALECCGLRSPLDQPWPFPDHHGANACRENFGRERSCETLWREREVQVLAIWIAVGASGLIVKVWGSRQKQVNPMLTVIGDIRTVANEQTGVVSGRECWASALFPGQNSRSY